MARWQAFPAGWAGGDRCLGFMKDDIERNILENWENFNAGVYLSDIF